MAENEALKILYFSDDNWAACAFNAGFPKKLTNKYIK